MRVIGSILLISGSCIGAGMLGLPVVAGLSGFIPGTLFFWLIWAYLLITSLLLLEAYLWYPQQPVNLITVAKNTVGEFGKWLAIVSFILLFYLLMIAYLNKGGQLVQLALEQIVVSLGLAIMPPIMLPNWLGSLLLTIITTILVTIGTKQVDIFNRAGMLGLLVIYITLLSLTPKHASVDVFVYQDYSTFLFVVPFLIVSFGFHNMVPTIKDYLRGDKQRIVTAIIIGSFIPLLVYLFWNLAVLLVVPLQGEHSLITAYKLGQIATEPLAKITKTSSLAVLSQWFAFFAIITSIFGQALSVVDFLADAIKTKFIHARWHYVLLFFVPCFVLSQLKTNVFFTALEYAGGLSAMLLFGFMPGLIVWRGRYKLRLVSSYIVPGGKPLLIVIMFAGMFIFLLEISKLLGIIDLTPSIITQTQ